MKNDRQRGQKKGQKGRGEYPLKQGDFDETNTEAINELLRYASGEVVKSLGVIRKEYNQLYKYYEEGYQEILEVAKKKNEIDNQWNKLLNGQLVSAGLKRIVAVWLSSDAKESEREYEFAKAIEELKKNYILDYWKLTGSIC